mgnify:CR=1 FL=1
MKRYNYIFRILCLVLVVSCVCTTFFIIASAETVTEDATVISGYRSLDATTAFLGSGQLVVNATAAIVYETSTQTLMYAWNPDVQVYPSSLVKILTALLVVELGNPEDIITVSEATLATVPYDAVSAELKPNEQISVADLLYCMMVGSANDAAAVLAEYVAGTQDAFVQKMNVYAQELGCTATQFRNVHGLHDDQQYTTVRDMARILDKAVQSEQFVTYFSTVNYTIPATNLSESRDLSSGNFLINNDNMEIYYDSRVIGGRTGVTQDGKRCLAASAEGNGLQVISIVMGAESTFAEDGNTMTYGSFKETSTLLDAALGGYKVAQVLYSGQALCQRSVLNGDNDVVLGSQVSLSTILPEDTKLENLTYRYSDVTDAFQAPISAGDLLSNVQVWYGNVCIAQTGLVAMNNVAVASEKMDNGNSTADGNKTLLSVILWIGIVGVLFVVVLWITRRIPAIIKRNRMHRYRQDRKRSR